MARFRADEADNYGGQGGGGYFSLKDDGDVARVRFCYNTLDDVEGYAVHEVEIDGRKRYVECIREYNQPISECPFCEAHIPQRAKLFIPLYDMDEDKIKVWERGKKFFAQISSLCSRYTNSDTDLVNNVFEIERQGKKGSTSTTYGIYQVDKDDTAIEDLPDSDDIKTITERIVLQKSFDDMNCYLDTGEFPPEEEEEVQPRRGARREREEEPPARRGGNERRNTGRRTPANSRRGDKF